MSLALLDPSRAAYIEAELLKRRGGVPLNEPDDAATIAAKKAAAYDPQEELYAIAEQYRNEQRVRQKGEDDEEGGNVVNSMAMLTASQSPHRPLLQLGSRLRATVGRKLTRSNLRSLFAPVPEVDLGMEYVAVACPLRSPPFAGVGLSLELTPRPSPPLPLDPPCLFSSL